MEQSGDWASEKGGRYEKASRRKRALLPGDVMTLTPDNETSSKRGKGEIEKEKTRL